MAPPRDKFGIDLDKESFNKLEFPRLSIAIWPGRKDPSTDVIHIQIRGLVNENYENVAEISLYRDGEGYRKLPPRQQVEQKQETLEMDTSKHDILNKISKETEDISFVLDDE